ncbi:MAG: AmmeMemoRadiSam system radical SAM enzyme [Planctomycetaceae bacterium]|nr:AmmeMemoRadiSam system radical SAM enzyme [Planctomycetaceae bacterium]
MQDTLKRAVLWERQDQKIRCSLCAWRCLIPDGGLGRCRVRKNIGGVLYSLIYDKICAASPDPIEKKPLFHFHPGSKAFSIAAPGCNFQCSFCQNWQISQMANEGAIEGASYTPAEIVRAAQDSGCQGIAYTYTEPTIFMELCADTARLAKAQGLYSVFVSNGYMTPEAIDFAKDWLDAINIDLKAFTEEFYRDLCRARLKPVLDTIHYIAGHTSIWMELTTLVIPGKNDSDKELKAIAEFIAKEVSVDVPWHISRFFPQYKMSGNVPTNSAVLERAYHIGKQAGLRYIYIGNMPGMEAESTHCYHCGALLIERVGHWVRENKLKTNRCPQCDSPIAGMSLIA